MPYSGDRFPLERRRHRGGVGDGGECTMALSERSRSVLYHGFMSVVDDEAAVQEMMAFFSLGRQYQRSRSQGGAPIGGTSRQASADSPHPAPPARGTRHEPAARPRARDSGGVDEGRFGRF